MLVCGSTHAQESGARSFRIGGRDVHDRHFCQIGDEIWITNETRSDWLKYGTSAFSEPDQKFLLDWKKRKTVPGNPDGSIDLYSDLVLALFLSKNTKSPDPNTNLEDSSPLKNDGVNNTGEFYEDRFGRANSALLFQGIAPPNEADPTTGPAKVEFNRNLEFKHPVTHSVWFFKPSTSLRAEDASTLESDTGVEDISRFEGGGFLSRWSRGPGKLLYLGFHPQFSHQIVARLSFPAHRGYVKAKGRLVKDKWCHVAATYDGATAKLYIDGVLHNERTLVLGDYVTITKEPVVLGREEYQGPNFVYFYGLLDDALIYRRALNAQEIQALYKAGEDFETRVREKEIDKLRCVEEIRDWTAKLDESKVLKARLGSATNDGEISLVLEDGRSIDTNISFFSESDIEHVERYLKKFEILFEK